MRIKIRREYRANIAVLAGVAFASAPALAAVQYGITDLGSPFGRTNNFATSINSAGAVGGYAFDGLTFEAVEYGPGGSNPQSLGTLGGVQSEANGINDQGQVVGWSYTSFQGSSRTDPFLYTPGTGLTDLGPAIGGQGIASDINNSSQVVGWAFRTITGTNTERGFVYTPGVGATILPAFGTKNANRSHVTAINDSGMAVGWSDTDTAGAFHAFLYSNGQMKDLGGLGGTESWAYAINSHGDIAGTATDQFGSKEGFIYKPGQGMVGLGGFFVQNDALGINDLDQVVGYGENSTPGDTRAIINNPGIGWKDLNTLIPANSGWTLSEATAINNAGQIVGYGTNPSGATDAFLLTPLPEPSAAGLLAVGAAMLLRRSRKRTT